MKRTLYVAAYATWCALALAICGTADASDSIDFPVHIMYRAQRLQMPTQTTRLQVCPMTTPLPACLLGDGWIDPINTSPVPGYWLRHVVYRTDGAAVLFMCRDGGLCEGDE